MEKDNDCPDCPHNHNPIEKAKCCKNRDFWTKVFESCEKIWKNPPLPKLEGRK